MKSAAPPRFRLFLATWSTAPVRVILLRAELGSKRSSGVWSIPATTDRPGLLALSARQGLPHRCVVLEDVSRQPPLITAVSSHRRRAADARPTMSSAMLVPSEVTSLGHHQFDSG